MIFTIIASYLPYVAVTAFTPGPNNVLALYAISQQGWKKGKNMILGIAIGFLCVMLLSALFCYELAKFVPSVAGTLNYVGAAYILWLAIHIAKDKPGDTQTVSGSFSKGFFLQFANVKIILCAITVFTSYVLPYHTELSSLLLHALSITVIGISGTLVWALAGGIFQRFLARYYRPFNIIMALILIYCAVTLVLP